MQNPNSQVTVNARGVESMERSNVSLMPSGLLDAFAEDEVLDLFAYLLSRGDRNAAIFRR
jgi:hypothetical protein